MSADEQLSTILKKIKLSDRLSHKEAPRESHLQITFKL